MRIRRTMPVLVGGVLLLGKLTVAAMETTVFVNKYFEVRDHDAPVKYVWNGPTRVATITGSLATNTRIQRLRLYPGWNLCSLAVTTANVLRQFNSLSASGGEGQGEVVLSAFKWNLPSQSWLPTSTNESLAAGAVLWLKAGTNATVTVIGDYADPMSQQVHSGGAYIPSTGLEAWTPNFPPTLSAWMYAAESNQWHEQLAGDLAFISNLPPTLSPGQAFYAQTASPASLGIPDPTLRIRYYHQDHLGSSSVITDASGALVEEAAYYPFGVSRNQYRLRQIEEHYTFTQKERDRESSLHYFEARYLAAGLARFVTPDPKLINPEMLFTNDLVRMLREPQKLNLSGYARNNPVVLYDPDGLDPIDTLAQESKAVLRGAKTVGQRVERAIDKAGEGVDAVGRGVGAVGEGVNKGVHAVGRGVHAVGQGVRGLGGGIKSLLKPVTHWRTAPSPGPPVINLEETEEVEIRYQITVHDDAPLPPGPQPVLIRPHPKPAAARELHLMSPDECWTGIHRLRP